MTQLAIGFNQNGKSQFEGWFNQISKSDKISMNEIQAYFDSNEYMNFETGENLYIEIDSHATKSGNPTTFTITNDMVEFINEVE